MIPEPCSTPPLKQQAAEPAVVLLLRHIILSVNMIRVYTIMKLRNDLLAQGHVHTGMCD